jgi:hypothetical protein
MTHIIAERKFKQRGGASVVARIYAPERIEGSSEWLCWVQIEGLETPFKKRAIGVDSFQALDLGLRLLYRNLDKIGKTLSFLDGPEGDTMTPLIVDWPSDPAGKAEIDRYVKDKVKAELERRRREDGPHGPA